MDQGKCKEGKEEKLEKRKSRVGGGEFRRGGND